MLAGSAKFMNLRRWLRGHSLRLLAIRDTPEAIAGGVAIGIFLGFTPLFGLKTASAIFFAWVTRSNVLASVLACTLHDILLPLMPAVFLWEYDVGFWVLNHRFPESMVKFALTPENWHSWATFVTIGKPLLLGSAVCGAPISVATFFITRRLVRRHQLKKQSHPPSVPRKDRKP